MQFRFYCLNEEDRIVVGDNVAAPDLDSAIRAAYEACRDHPHFPTSRIEIWQGSMRLYSSEHACAGRNA
jgi:hypothetical protein